jgi:hypothetical protein
MLVVRFDTDQPAGRPVREQLEAHREVPRSAARQGSRSTQRARQRAPPSVKGRSQAERQQWQRPARQRPDSEDSQPHGGSPTSRQCRQWNQPQRRRPLPKRWQAPATSAPCPCSRNPDRGGDGQKSHTKYPITGFLKKVHSTAVRPLELRDHTRALSRSSEFQRGVPRLRQHAPGNATGCQVLWPGG